MSIDSQTNNNNKINADIVIIGAGIVGLWLLARLKNLGFKTVLLESTAIGAGQTRHAQGIIHGGIKYSLSGSRANAAIAVSDMPNLWKGIVLGENNLNIQGIKQLSSHQLLWSTENLTSRLTTLFAGHLTRTPSKLLRSHERPLIFNHDQFKGTVYQVEEPVIDMYSLLCSLSNPHLESIMHIQEIQQISHLKNKFKQINLTTPISTRYQIRTNAIILAAGKGNSELLHLAGYSTPQMQLRPLRMVLVRGDLPPLFAHCLGMSDKPRVTITTHFDQYKNTIWYIGGQLAEEGAKMDDTELLTKAKQEFRILFPWMDPSQLQWSTVYIERAEHQQKRTALPHSYYTHEQSNLITTWPTKMALTPLLVEEVVNIIKSTNISPSSESLIPNWPNPPLCSLPWNENTAWN